MSNIDAHFRAFGLPSTATLVEVKETRQLYIKAFHPDRYPKDSQDQKKAEEKQKELNLAFEKIDAWFKSGRNGEAQPKKTNARSKAADWHEELEEYIDYLSRSDRRERTVRNIFCDLVRLADWLEVNGFQRATAMNSEELLSKYFVHLTGLHYSASTIARHLYSIRGWFAFCRMETDFILVWATQCKASSSKKIRRLTEKQVAALLSSAKRFAKEEDWILLEFLLQTGLTAGEVCAICWGDVSTARSQGSRRLALTLMVEGPSKVREIPLNDKAIDLLVSLGLNEMIKNRGKTLDMPIFARDNSCLTPKMVHYTVTRLATEAKVDVTPSLLRNFFAFKLADSGVPRHHLAEYLGISEQSASVYYPAKKVSPADLLAASRKI